MTGVEERADVRMIQAGDGFGFAVKTFAQLGTVGEMSGKNLDGDDALEARVAGFVHLSHSARTDGGENFIRSEFGARVQGHFFSPAVQLA
jgi:hypothetical protein